jgi:hypothetical protein
MKITPPYEQPKGPFPAELLAWLQSKECELLCDQILHARYTGCGVPGNKELILATWLAAVEATKNPAPAQDCPHAAPFRF